MTTGVTTRWGGVRWRSAAIAVAVAVAPAGLTGMGAAAATPNPATPHAWVWNATDAGVALDGFDVVAYHDGEATPGVRGWAVTHAGLSWWFSTEERRDRFIADPERYLPVCGGWDALVCGVDPAQAGFAPARWSPTPGSFRLHEGRLLLLSERPEFNTVAAWDASAAHDALVERADAFWADRLERAAAIGHLPAGMDRRARLELAEWFPLLGTWRCEGFIQSPQGERSIGTADWEWGFGYDGHLIEDHWRPHDNPSASGPAFRVYDPLAREWGMVFIPSTGPSAAWWRMTGRWEGGELRGEFSQNDGRILGTIRFYDIGEESFSWISDRSFDGGESWQRDYQRTSCTRVGPGR